MNYICEAPYENTALTVNKKFGIESIAKKGGYPSQNDFALSVSMARFGIELIAKRTDTFLKTTSGPALAR